jgi:hypothetical protein
MTESPRSWLTWQALQFAGSIEKVRAQIGICAWHCVNRELCLIFRRENRRPSADGIIPVLISVGWRKPSFVVG